MASAKDQKDSLRLIVLISELEEGGLAEIGKVRAATSIAGQRFNELMEGLQNNRIIEMKVVKRQTVSPIR